MKLHIGWLFPELLSTYGDRGNLLCLEKRALWRGLSVEVVPITSTSDQTCFSRLDIIVGGGSQSREQVIASDHLKGAVGLFLLEKLEEGTPGLFICGSMQLLGKSFQISSKESLKGLGFFDCSTTIQEGSPRLTGDLTFQITAPGLLAGLEDHPPLILGFENHAGSTFLGNVEPLGQVVRGHGNNGVDGHEGLFYKQAIGSYAHGPILPKNPFLADWLIERALEKRYGRKAPLALIENLYTNKARETLLVRQKIRNGRG